MIYVLGRPLGYLTFSLMALIRDPIYQYFSEGFRGQPSVLPIRELSQHSQKPRCRGLPEALNRVSV